MMSRNAVFIAIIKVAFLSLIVFVFVGLVLLFVVIPGLVRGDEVAIPNLINQSHEQAIQLVYNAGLQLDPELEKKPSDVVPEGYVIEQEPLANFKVKRNKPVRLTVSVGSERISVPDVVGKSFGDAENILKSAGFPRGRVATVHSDRYPTINTAIAQTPLAGSTNQRGTFVHLLLSSGPRPKILRMPDLRRVGLDEVRTLLESHHLKIGRENYALHPEINQGLIISHEPDAGALVPVGQVVNLVVSGSPISPGEKGEFVVIKHEVSSTTTASKHVTIFVVDDRGKKRVIDKNYQSGFPISQPYKVVGEATMIVYEDNIEVMRKKLW